jgi:hypothetical protein
MAKYVVKLALFAEIADIKFAQRVSDTIAAVRGAIRVAGV